MAQTYRKARKFVNCTLSFEEYTVLQERAKEAGRTPTTYLRETVFAYLEQQPILPKAVEIRMGTLVALLRNMAGNLNQIARHTNRLQKLTVIDALQARSLVFQLEKAVKNFIAGSLRKP
jgi:predicted DNA-binding protein